MKKFLSILLLTAEIFSLALLFSATVSAQTELKPIANPGSPGAPATSPTVQPPAFSGSKGLIPCGFGQVNENGFADSHECTFADLLTLANNLINYLILLVIPLSAVVFAYAGFLVMTAGDSSDKVSKAKAMSWKVVWGLGFALGAWVIVHLIVSVLLAPGTISSSFGL